MSPMLFAASVVDDSSSDSKEHVFTETVATT